MASDKGAPMEELDDRVAQAGAGVLINGEEVVAQEPGDQGQAILLTNFRVIIIKVGLAATGQPNGSITNTYRLADISAVKVRKGPMGAVIQICTQGDARGEAGHVPPDNLVVFSGVQKAKRCRAVAEAISKAAGKVVELVQPGSKRQKPNENPGTLVTAEPVEEPVEAAAEASEEIGHTQVQRASKEARPLTEKMFEESKQAGSPEAPQAVPAAESVQAAAASVPEQSVVFEDEEPEEIEFNPNPRLPKPVWRNGDSGKRTLVVLAASLGVLFIGLCSMAPLRQSGSPKGLDINVKEISRNLSVEKLQSNAVQGYNDSVRGILLGSGLLPTRGPRPANAIPSQSTRVGDPHWGLGSADAV